MDIASLRMVIDSRDVKRGKDDLDGLARQGDATERRIGRSTQRMSGSFASMTSFIKQAAAAMLAFKTAESFVRIADQASQVEARIKLVTAATESYAQVQQRLVAISNKNFQLLSATANLYAKLKPSMTAMNKSTEDAFQVVDAFGKALRIGGAATQEAAAATMQFSQAMASGVLRGDEFNSIAEASPRILQAIADGSGYAAGELRALAADGVLSAKLVSEALQSQLGVLTAEAERIPQTVGGAFQVLQNNLLLTIDAINKSSGATEGMKAVIAGLSSAAEFAGGILISTFSAINTFVKTTDGAIGALKDTLVVAAGAAAGFAFAVNIGPVIGIATIALTGMVAQVQMATAGMTAAAIATRGMGAALAFLAAHPAIIVFATVGASIAYVNREYDKLIAKAEADKARTDQQRGTLKGLNDERERLSKIGKGMTESQGREIEQRERFIQQLRDEKHSQDAINSALAVFDANAKKRRDLSEATQAAEQQRLVTAKAAAEAEQQAKKAAQDRLRLAEQFQQKRADFAQDIADLQTIQRLVHDGLTVEEARARVQMARQGALGAEVDALMAQQAAVDRLAEREKMREEGGRLYLEVLKEMNQEQIKQAEDAQRTIDTYLGKDYGADLAAGFDQASQSLGQFVNGFSKLAEMQADYDKARAAAGDNAGELAKLELKNAKNQINAYGNITGAAKGFFKEGSKGYKAMEAAEQTFRAVQLALAIKDVAVKLGLMGTETAAVVATEGVKQTSYAITAQAAALTIPPPASFAALAAVIAVLASLGLGGRGGSAPAFTDNSGTGTVFGDAGTQSESIKKSIDLLGDAATLENRISTQMLAALRSIEANIGGLTNLIIRTGGAGEKLAGGVSTGLTLDTSSKMIIKGLDAFGKTLNTLTFGISDMLGIGALLGGIGKLIGGAFGTTTKIKGFGLTAPDQLMGDILGGGFNLQEFVAIQKKKKSFGITTSKKNSIKRSAADEELARQFTLIFTGFADAIKIAAEPLGIATSDITSRLNAFVVDIGMINLKGLSGAKIQEKLTAVFGQQADLMAKAALAGLDPFQRVGEGYFETLVRVASGVEMATNATKRLGISAISYSAITYKQGDVGVELLRQSLVLAEQARAGIARIIGDATSESVEELESLANALFDLRDAIIATGNGFQDVTYALIEGAGTVQSLQDGLQSYFEDYLTDQEQAAELTRRLTGDFARLGLALPGGIDGFKQLVKSIDTTTEAGQRLFGGVIALAPGFSDLQDALASVKDEAQDAKDAITKAFKDLSDAIKTAESDLQAAFNRESAALKDLIRNHDDAAKRLRDFSRTLVGALDTPEQSLSRLRAEFDAIARAARLGDSAAVSRLPEVGGALKDAVLANAVTALDAAREIARIRAESDAAATVQERQKTIAEQQLDALTLSVDGLIRVGDNILTVRDAVDNLKALQSFENKAIADATSLGLNSLAQQNGLTLSAIERGTAASNAINAGIASLVGIQAKQEADRQAAAERQAKINALTAQAKPLADTVAQAGAVRSQSAADLAKLQADAYALASAKGVAINAESGAANFTNTAQFGIGESGLYEQKFGQISFRNSPAGANAFKSEFYAAGGIYDQILAEAAQLASAKSAMETSEAQLNALRQQITALGGIPAFATGGMHSGGLRLVGENGPELEYTGPSRIFNAGQTSSMLDNSDQIAELRALRDEMKGYLWSISKSTLRTADRLDRWDDGDRMNVRIDNESDDPALVRTVA